MSYAAPAQVLEYFAPVFFSASAGLFATATRSSILSLPCPPSTLALVVEYIAPAPAVYAAPAPVMVYIALTQAVSYAAQAQVLEFFAPASSASVGPSATATGSSILTKSRPSSLQSVFARRPTSFAVPFGNTSFTTMLLWPALSPDAQKSSSLSAVVDYTWAQIPVIGCSPWFERVPSKCNIVDGLSRKTSPLRP